MYRKANDIMLFQNATLMRYYLTKAAEVVIDIAGKHRHVIADGRLLALVSESGVLQIRVERDGSPIESVYRGDFILEWAPEVEE